MLSYQLLICFGYLQRVREVFGADVKLRSCLLTCHHSESKTNTPAPAEISPRPRLLSRSGGGGGVSLSGGLFFPVLAL